MSHNHNYLRMLLGPPLVLPLPPAFHMSVVDDFGSYRNSSTLYYRFLNERVYLTLILF